MIHALDVHRVAHLLHRHGVPGLPRVLRRVTQLVWGTYIGTEARIGAGTELAYGGLGIVIHPRSRIGRRVLVGPHVVIGGRSDSRGGPTIGDDVKIGAGASLLGDIIVGEGALIGAGAVVIDDVAPHAVVVGVPARAVAADGDVDGDGDGERVGLGDRAARDRHRDEEAARSASGRPPR